MNLFALETMETQTLAINIVQMLLETNGSKVKNYYSAEDLEEQWVVDFATLMRAQPFAWTKDPIKAVNLAAPSVPGDTPLTKRNLDTDSLWWYFEEPLQLKTTTEENVWIRAISGMWCSVRGRDNKDLFILSCWVESNTFKGRLGTRYNNPRGLAPSQVFSWFEDESLDDMITRVSWNHDKVYGEGGTWNHISGYALVGKDVFMETCNQLARFILAGTAWMAGRAPVLTTNVEDGIARQRRKEYKRTFNREANVKVVRLRRQEPHDTENVETENHRDYAFRFVVRGHWRNQAYGPRHSERKLTWVMSFVKGPEDKPLKERPTVYVVNR